MHTAAHPGILGSVRINLSCFPQLHTFPVLAKSCCSSYLIHPSFLYTTCFQYCLTSARPDIHEIFVT